MSKWSVERWAASTGLGFAVLLLVGALLPGSPKKWNASAVDVQSYLQGKHKEILISGILFGIGYVLFLWFLASFAGYFRDAGQGRLATIMYGAGVAAVTIAAIGDGITVAVAKLTYTDDTNTVRALYGMSNFVYGRFFWMLAALALATWLAVKRSKAMPDWYAWLSLLGAAVFVLGGLSIKNHGFFSPTGGMAFIAFFGFIVWIAISSFGLVKKTA